MVNKDYHIIAEEGLTKDPPKDIKEWFEKVLKPKIKEGGHMYLFCTPYNKEVINGRR